MNFPDWLIGEWDAACGIGPEAQKKLRKVDAGISDAAELHREISAAYANRMRDLLLPLIIKDKDG